MVLSVMQAYAAALTFESVDKILSKSVITQMDAAVVLFILLHRAFLTFTFSNEIVGCDFK